MSRNWGDGFEGYATGTDLAARVDAYNNATIMNASHTAFNVGQSVANADFTKIFEGATNETTLYFSVRLKYESAVTGSGRNVYLTFMDAATDQVTIEWTDSKQIIVRSGGKTGTILATYTNAFNLNVHDSWQGKIVINNTTGSVELRKNGNSTNFVTALTGVNTRAGSANAYVNAIKVFEDNTWVMDDLFVNNNDGTAPSGWPTDYRNIPSLTTGAGGSTDFLPDLSPRILGQTVNTFFEVLGGDEEFGIQFVAPVSGTITTILLEIHANMTGHMRAAIVAADAAAQAGGPGTLLEISAELTNPVAGVTTFTLNSTVTLTRGVAYWIFFFADATVSVNCNSGNGTLLATWNRTYSAGYQANLNLGYGGSVAPCMYTNLTPFNWSLVSEVAEDGDTTFVQSGTLNAKDMYTIAALGVTPTSIIGVEAMLIVRKSNSGPRSVALMVNANSSGDTEQVVGDLSNGYTAVSKFMPLDPTGAAWTQAHVEAAQVGIKVKI